MLAVDTERDRAVLGGRVDREDLHVTVTALRAVRARGAWRAEEARDRFARIACHGHRRQCREKHAPVAAPDQARIADDDRRRSRPRCG